MPCFTRTEITIDAGKLNAERLEKTIQEMTFSGFAKIQNGKLLISGTSEENARELHRRIMQNYAAATIKEASKRFGWTAKAQATTTAGNIKINLVRR
jgi:hypothetical protein